VGDLLRRIRHDAGDRIHGRRAELGRLLEHRRADLLDLLERLIVVVRRYVLGTDVLRASALGRRLARRRGGGGLRVSAPDTQAEGRTEGSGAFVRPERRGAAAGAASSAGSASAARLRGAI